MICCIYCTFTYIKGDRKVGFPTETQNFYYTTAQGVICLI